MTASFSLSLLFLHDYFSLFKLAEPETLESTLVGPGVRFYRSGWIVQVGCESVRCEAAHLLCSGGRGDPGAEMSAKFGPSGNVTCRGGGPAAAGMS